MRKSVFAVLSGVLATLMVAGGCSSSPAANSTSTTSAKTAVSAAASSSASKEIGIVFTDLNNPVFVDMKNAMEEKAKELGYTTTVLNSQDNSDTELQNVQNLVSKKVAAICLLPNDANSAINTVKVANDANIPIVGFNRVIDTKDQCKFVTQDVTDNVSGAVEAGKYAVQLLKDVKDPKIVILRGTSGVDADKQRYDGFVQGIKGTALEGAIIAQVNGQFDTQTGFTVMQNVIQAQPKIDLVYAENDTMALGALQALEAANRKNVKIIGYDGSSECVQKISEGKITATVAQKFKALGTTAVEWAAKAAEGKAADAPATISIDTELVTAENAKGYVFK